MLTRKAHARWEGSLSKGGGQVETGSRALRSSYSFASRFEDGKGTNPEELLGAAHAGCFAMALTYTLEQAGFAPVYVDAIAEVTLAPRKSGEGFSISGSHLICKARVPGLDQAGFLRYAEAAKVDCPISRAIAGVEITLDAALV
ncbi:MAG: OsmC family protein [Chromatiales bacterium]|jgi:osmotically inducible protein OsmC|nr:OsmC family protein [Chromatiales bacterium]